MDAIDVFLTVRTQFIMGMNGPVSINHLAVDAAIKRKGIQDHRVFDKVSRLSEWWLERIRNK